MQEKSHEIQNLSLPHFLAISSNLALLQLPNENFYMVSRDVNSPNKSGPNPLWLAPHMITLKSSANLYVPPSPINMTTMIRKYTKFPLSAISPGKPVHQAIHYPTANFRPLSRGSIPSPMLIINRC